MTTAERYERYRFLLWMAFASMFIVAISVNAQDVKFATVGWTTPPIPPDGTEFVLDTQLESVECRVAAARCTFTFTTPQPQYGFGCFRPKTTAKEQCRVGLYWMPPFNVGTPPERPKPKRRAVGGKR